jgi:drug/metabolite transporter (DMT)-like permease
MGAKVAAALAGIRGSLGMLGTAQILAALGMLVVNQVSNVGAATLFALSGRADRWRTFIVLQILGGFFGIFIQVSFAGMVRYASFPFANAAGFGLAFVSAQIFSAAVILKEPISPLQWLGSAFVLVGVLLVSLGHR